MSRQLLTKQTKGSLPSDLETDIVDIPEWNCAIKVRALTAGERNEYETSLFEWDPKRGRMKRPDTKDANLRLIVIGAIDDDGSAVFERSDIPMLRQKSSGPLSRVASRIRELSGFDQEDSETMEKNSGPPHSDTSASPSH